MKIDIYFDYKVVVFCDFGLGEMFFICLIVISDKIIELDGVEYLVIDVEIFLVLYFFYMGKQCIMDLVGCVEKFNQCFKGFGGLFK